MTRRALTVIGPLVAGIALLACAELLLALAGWPAPAHGGLDPTFPRLFHPARRTDGTPVLRRPDDATEFLATKPPAGLRVFVVGASSVHGFPYGAAWAFPARLERRLAAAHPDRVVEVVNCGLEGIASWHVRQIVEEIVAYEPDVVIVYAGHNDWMFPAPASDRGVRGWLAHLRLSGVAARAGAHFGTWGGDRGFDPEAEPYGAAHDRARGRNLLDAGARARIATRVEHNLRAIVALSRAAGAEPVLATLGQNLGDWRPGGSRPHRGLTARDRDRWRRRMRAAERRGRQGDPAGVLRALAAAARIDDRPALLHFARGRALEALADWPAARTAYQEASDRDEVPCGAPRSQNALIRRVARESGALLVDVAAGLGRASPHGIAGRALFVDHVHPTLLGHERIAAVFADALAPGAPGPAATGPAPAAVHRAHPELARAVHEARMLLLLVLARPEAARHEAAVASRRYPELRNRLRDLQWYLASTGRGMPPGLPRGSDEPA